MTTKTQSEISEQRGFAGNFTKRLDDISRPVTFVVFVGLWELVVRIFNIPEFILPPPSLICRSLWSGLKSGIYAYHTMITMKEIVIGFGVAVVLGLIFGGLVAQWRLAEKTLYPYLVAVETIPKIALAPIMIVWLGMGTLSKVAIAGLVAFFPVLVNTIQGLVLVEEAKLDLMYSLGASQWQIFWKLKVPNALPLIFTGLDTASVLCVLGAITGEFVGSHAGLGNLILHYQYLLDIPSFFGVVVTLGVFGLLFHIIIRYIERRVVFWVRIGEEELEPPMQ